MGFAAALLAASPAAAEINGGEFSISPFAGALVYDGSQRLSSSFAVGTRLGYNATRNLGIEGQFTYARPRYKGKNGNIYNTRGDILYHFFPDKKLVPFFAIGGGWMGAEAGPSQSRHATFDYGVGLKYFLNDSVALRGDFRQVMSIRPNSRDDTWQNSEITVGVTFQFGGVKRVSPPVAEAAAAPAAAPVATPPKVVEDPECWTADGAEVPSGKIAVTGICLRESAVEIQAGERIRKYGVFTLAQPSRLVIDISNAASGFKAGTIRTNRLGIAAVRFENYPEFLRIFLDAGQGRILPYRVEESDPCLRIIMTPFNVPSPDKEP